MSLLMEALKRAEASKAARPPSAPGQEEASRGEGLSLEPLARDATAGPLPDLAAHLAAVDAELAAAATPRAEPSAARFTAPGAQAVARNSFIVKPEPAAGHRGPLWLALGGLALVALTIGGYVWHQMSSLDSGGLSGAGQPLPVAASRPSAEPVAPIAPVAPALVAPAPPAESPPLPAAAPRPPPTLSPMLAAPPRAEAPPVASLIRVARTPPRLDPDLVYAHARLQAGDLAGASQAFALVLQRDPNQTDALLALAAIAQHQGRPDEAESWRQRALVADPSDPAVQAAALSGLAAGGEAQAAESRLKTLLAAQPQSAELNFALGNLYARQQRWAEAQQHFFNAVAADNDNPDYLFNLAVSLDQLRQPRPAAQHYRLALEAAARRPAAFDAEQVRRRLAALLPDSPP